LEASTACAQQEAKPEKKKPGFEGSLKLQPMEVSKETPKTAIGIPVTIQNVSNHNCTGGTVSLKNTGTGEIATAYFGAIGQNQQASRTAYMGSYPDLIGVYFTADNGATWGPAVISHPGGVSFVTLQLQPI